MTEACKRENFHEHVIIGLEQDVLFMPMRRETIQLRRRIRISKVAKESQDNINLCGNECRPWASCSPNQTNS